jgi:hypothetical protein
LRGLLAPLVGFFGVPPPPKTPLTWPPGIGFYFFVFSAGLGKNNTQQDKVQCCRRRKLLCASVNCYIRTGVRI